MVRRITNIGVLLQLDDADGGTMGRDALLALLGSNDGNCTLAAREGEVDVATIKRWIARAGVREDVERMRSEKPTNNSNGEKS